MEALAGGSAGRSADSQGHAGESDYRLHSGNRPILPSLLVPRSSSQTGASGRADRYRKVCLYHGVSAEEEQSRDLQAALRNLLGADHCQSDARYYHEQTGPKEERFVNLSCINFIGITG